MTHLPGMALAKPLEHGPPQSMDVECQYGQGHHAGKTLGPVGTDAVQPMVIKTVDTGFNRRMGTAHLDKDSITLTRPVSLAQTTLLRQGVHRKQFIQPDTIGRVMEATVKADHAQIRVKALGLLDHGNGIVHIAPVPHDLMVKHKAMIVFEYTDRDTQLLVAARLTLGLSLRKQKYLHCRYLHAMLLR